MRYENAFPSDYLKAADLNGAPVTVTIKNYELEEIKDKQTGKSVKKPILAFKGTDKRLVLNITNAKKIAQALMSPEMDDWIGRKIVLYPTVVEFAGDEVEAIRVRAAAAVAEGKERATILRPAATPTSVHENEEDPGAGLDDEIPF